MLLTDVMKMMTRIENQDMDEEGERKQPKRDAIELTWLFGS